MAELPSCQERREQFLLDAVGALEPAESQELHAHLASGCPICAGSAAEAQALIASITMGLEPVQPDPRVLSELMKRVQASAPVQSSDGLSPSTPPASSPVKQIGVKRIGVKRIGVKRIGVKRIGWGTLLTTSALAACLAGAVTAGIMWQALRSERLLQTPDLRFVSLAGSTPQPKARGRIFWDADHGYWHVYVFDLAAPPAGKQYELWFIGNDGRKTAAGVFDVNKDGDARVTVQVPPDLGPLAAAAVTDEQAGGVAQPQGSVQLLGKIQ